MLKLCNNVTLSPSSRVIELDYFGGLGTISERAHVQVHVALVGYVCFNPILIDLTEP